MPVTRRFLRDAEAVSTVVSAVLVFSLVVIVLSVYMSAIVPDQIGDAEASHLRRVSSALGDVAADITNAAARDREGEFAVQIDLGTTTVPGLSFFHSSGSLQMRESSFFANFVCYSPHVLLRDQSAAAGGTPAALGPFVDFVSFDALELQVSSYSFGASDDSGTFTVTSDAEAVASLKVTLVAATQSVKVTTRDRDNSIVFEQIVFSGINPLTYTVDALDPSYGFSDLLGDAEGPFELATSGTSAALGVYGVYTTEDGMILPLGQGRPLDTAFQRTVAPAALVYAANNNKFLDQVYAYEAGALVLDQPNGQFLFYQPFGVTSTPAGNVLRLDLVNMTGSGYVTGSHRVTVSVNVQDPTSSVLTCSNPTLLLDSDYVDGWYASWTEALAAEDLDPTQATLSGGTLQVRLTGAWTVVLEEARTTVRLT